MPKIQFGSTTLECAEGANLRKALLDAKAPLYNPPMRAMNCHGFGTCGTCAVRVDGPVSEMTGIERWRLSVPPHKPDNGLRLACQCKVLGDVNVTKYPGKWGEKTGKAPVQGSPQPDPTTAS